MENTLLWGTDLTAVLGFFEAVEKSYNAILSRGVRGAVEDIVNG
jgi:uncharacterized protein YktA (UPF0223 family)